MPPGTYYLAAVTDVEPSDLGDSAFLEQLAQSRGDDDLKKVFKEVEAREAKIGALDGEPLVLVFSLVVCA